jgi:cell division septation protein DedD
MRGLSDQRGKFEISGAGILLLAVATLATSGLVFLLGVYVGKGIVEQRLAQNSRVVRLPVPTPGATSKTDEVDVTFWDKLAKGEAATPVPPAPTPTTTETPVRIVPSQPSPRPTEPRAEAPTPAPTKPPAPAPVEKGTLQVQVNAMADKTRAEELVRDLKSLGYTAYLSPARVGGKTLYRVRVSHLASEQAAKQTVARLREQGYPEAFLVAEGSDR